MFIKTIGLILVEGAGLSLGSRGPLIHISCCWGNIVSRFFRKYNENEAKRREIISAAAASGISAGFGSPIGGVLFSSEALSAHFPPKTMWRSFVCAVATALFLKFMYAFPDGKIVPFQIKYQHNFLWFEILPFCIIGMIGGLLGALFIRLNLYIHSARTRFWNDSPIIEVAFIALATSCFGLFTVFLRESNVNFVASLFEVCENLNPFTDLNSKLCQ